MHLKLLAVVAFCLLYNLLLYKSGLGIGTFLLMFLFNGMLFLLRNKDSKYLKLGYTFSVLSVLYSFFISFRSNEIILPINFLFSIISSLLAFFFYNLGPGFNFSLTQYLKIPFKSLTQLIEGIFKTPKLVDQRKLAKVNTPHSSALLRGLLFAFPLVIVFIFLFNLADPIYNKYTVDLMIQVQKILMGPIWERILISAIILIVSFGALAALLKLRHEGNEEEIKNIEKSRQVELITFLSLPVLIFLSFIIVQFEYLFSNVGERQLSQIGIHSLTYSEYVRKGFFELLIVSSIALSIIGFISRFVHRAKNNYETILKSLITLLVVETQIILFSVVWRVIMYQMEHGLTRNRVFGMFVLTWLSLILFTFLTKSLIKLKPKITFLSVTIISAIIVSLLSVVNIDALIVEKFKPTVNERIDYNYMSNLSFDAAEAWPNTIQEIDQNISKITQKGNLEHEDYYQIHCMERSLFAIGTKKKKLLNKYGTNVPDITKNWQEFNFSEYNAYALVQNNKQLFDKAATLQQSAQKVIEEYDKKRLEDLSKSRSPYRYFPPCGSL